MLFFLKSRADWAATIRQATLVVSLVIASAGLTTNTHAKPYVFEGFVGLVTPNYSGLGTHLLLDRPAPHGKVLAVLRNFRPTPEVRLDSRQRLLGRLYWRPRTADGLPVVEVLETRLAEWAEPQRAQGGGSFGNWNGLGGSLYPTLNPEPLPCRIFVGLDRDGDGVADEDDAFPDDPNETTDSDGDGIGDQADPDDDNDGIPDLYENLHGLNPVFVDALNDLDLDGLNNVGEWVAGTAANDAGSVFQIGGISPDSKSNVLLAWPSVAGRIYEVYFSSDAARGFTPLAPRIIGSNIWTTVELPVPRDKSEGFFRIQVRQP